MRLGHWPSSCSSVSPRLSPWSTALSGVHTPSVPPHGLSVHGYADNTQVYLTISDPTNSDSVRCECLGLEKCLANIHCWMSANMLKLNTEKTEVLVVGTLSKLKSLDVDSLNVGGSRVIITDKPVRNLGVMMDRHMAMSAQVRQVVRTAYHHLRNIGLARGMLTVGSTKQLVQALVISHLDYCNSQLMGIPDSLIHLLDMVQHRAARLIHRDSGDQSVTGLMKDLH